MAEYKPRKQAVDNYHQHVRGKGLSPQQMLEQGINGVLNSNPLTAPLNMIRNAVPQVVPALREGGKIVNSAVDAVPGAKEVLNHPALGVVTGAVPPVGAILGVAGAASQVAGGERATNPLKGNSEKPAAPAKPAETPYRSRREGLDATYPDRAPGVKSEKPGARVNANGLVSYGKDLSSLNAFTKEFTGGYELTDIKSAFQSNDLAGAYQNGSNKLSYQDTPYELDSGAKPSNVGGKYTMDGVDTSIQNTGYQISDKSVPGTIGGNDNDPQDGTSSKPDVAESIRTVRMQRKGPRDEGSFRGFQIDQANEFAQNSVSETKGNGMNEKRRAIRSTFLDMDTPIIKATVAANSQAGYGKDSNGQARFNYGGELVYAKDGMQQKAKNAAMMGEDPSPFLELPTTPDTQPDTPAASELSPAFAQEKPGAQEFFKNAISKVKDKNK